MEMENSILHGDCLDLLPQVPSRSVHMVLADLPYGTTQNKWDIVIPLDFLWKQYNRVIVPNGVIALHGSQPFTSVLVASNLRMYRHEWIWIKNRGSNFGNTVREPMKEHESVLIFSPGKWTYNRQMQERTGGGLARAKYAVKHDTQSPNYENFQGREAHEISDVRVPSSWQKFNVEVGLHPTQKPLLLAEYLIKTYSNPGDLILDNACGSGTTCLAAKNLGRRYIGMELNPNYFETACNRLK